MIAAWMLYSTAVALLAGLGAMALERGARVLGRAGRWYWVGGMVVTLVLPVAGWLQPAALRAVTPPATFTHSVAWTLGVWTRLDRPLAAAWGVTTLIMLAWLAVSSVRLTRLRRSWRLDGEHLISRNVGPAVVGFVKARVVLPEWSLGLDAKQRDLLLAHERQHLAAHDPRLLVASAALVALVPWNIGLWWQFRRLRLAVELDCDQRVLRGRPDRATYGRLLLEVGARAARAALPLTAFHEPMSSLERRIRTMTSPRSRRPRLLAAGLAVLAAAAAFVACEAPQPTAPALGGVYRVSADGQKEFRVDGSAPQKVVPDGRASLVLFQRDGAVGVKTGVGRVAPDTVRLIYNASHQ